MSTAATRPDVTNAPGAKGPATRTRRLPPPTVVAASAVLFVAAVAAIAPGVLASDPFTVDLGNVLSPPSWSHPFGTDLSGRDLYARIVHGTRESLLIGLGATAVALALASLLGFTAGLSPKPVAAVVNRVVEVLFAFPAILLALLLVSVFGPGRTTLIVAVGIGVSPGYARIIRGQVLTVRGSPYVEAAGALGHSRFRVFRRHIVPNALRPMAIIATLGVGQTIVWASGLAFLGLGVPPPAPEWGALLDAGRTYLTRAPWLEVFPGLVIVVIALAATTLGRHAERRGEGRA
ncbi:ABC transporter permease [Nocardia sp. BMG51109]|uniref:ABC transporter permease n=1 Tax=Nocardia sp. BMG51109 TaxID=1056816 RepID=UPI000464F1F6|nr:ABC transporter permease [Nocardia sp. BMG51109]